MAKLQVYKFVNPGSVGANAPAPVAAASKTTLALNRTGAIASSIGEMVQDLEKIALKGQTLQKTEEILARKRKRREMDAAAEEAQELEKLEKGKVKPKKDSKTKKGIKKSFGWLESFFGPIGSLLMKVATLGIITETLKYLSDPEKKQQIVTFLEKTKFVFEKLYGFAKGLTTTFLDGFSALMDPNSDFGTRLKGLGKVMLGITALKYLMNPFSLITDILGIIDLLSLGGGKTKQPKNQPKSKKTKKPPGVDPKTKKLPGSTTTTTKPVVKPQTTFTGIDDSPLNSPQRRIADNISKQHGNAARSVYNQRYNQLISEGVSPSQAASRAKADVLKRINKGQIKSKPKLGSLSTRSNRITATILGESNEQAAKLAGSSIFKKGMDKATQRFFLKILGMGGVKTLKKVLNRIPVIGPLITFALNWAAGESIAKSAAMAVGAGLGELLGTWAGGAIGAIGGPAAPITIPIGAFVGGMLGSIGGEALGGWLFSTITGEGGGSGGLGAVGESLMGAVKTLFTGEFWSQIGQGVAEFFGNVVRGIGGLWNMLGSMAEFLGVKNMFDALWEELGSIAGSMFRVMKYLANPLSWWKIGGELFKITKQLTKLFVIPGPIGFIWENGIQPFFENVGKLWAQRDKFFDFLMSPGTFQQTFGAKYEPSQTSPQQKDSQTGQPHSQGGLVQPQQLFIGGIVKGIKKAVSGVGKAVGSIVSNPIVQTAASFIPGAGPIIAGVNAVAGLASGNPMGAITQGLSMIPGVSGIMSQVGNFMDSPLGGIASNLMGGNFAGAITGGLNMINPALGAIGGNLMSGNFMGALSGGLNMINPNFGGIAQQLAGGNFGGAIQNAFNSFDIGSKLGSFGGTVSAFVNSGFDAMTGMQAMADQFGAGGIFRGITNAIGGDYSSAISEIGSDLGIDPKILGVASSATKEMMKPGGLSAEYVMNTAIDIVPIPVVLEKIVPIPQAVPINNMRTIVQHAASGR